MDKIPALFIINPVSGGKQKSNLIQQIKANLNSEKFDADYEFSQYAGHARELARNAVLSNIQLIVAVGGDGTINEVASEIVGTETILGIIPFGSGNGLARFLKVPLELDGATKLINRFTSARIDTGTINGKPFINVAGVGLDAHISHLFANSTRRGLMNYIRIGVTEYFRYRPGSYTIEVDGKRVKENALLITIANSSQYGNDFQISPHASVTDGLLDLCVVRPIPLMALPRFMYRMIFLRNASSTPFLEIVKSKHIRIIRSEKGPIHLDGEPMEGDAELEIEVQPLSLCIICPEVSNTSA